MDSKRSLSYPTRLFLLVLALSWLLMGCFLVFQYRREVQYKADALNARLQLLNMRMSDALNAGQTPEEVFARHAADFEGLRMTLIGLDGRVRYDSETARKPQLENHLDREEVREALREGTGFTLRRRSTSTDRPYFYAALRDGDHILRTALPYSLPLDELLRADRHFLWFLVGVTLLISLAGYYATRRLGQSIVQLREFADRLDKGSDTSGIGPFPHDELGAISTHLIRLYERLRQTSADLDEEHARTLHEEQEKLRIKRQLTNNINHELKTPVSAIHGYLETLLSTPDVPEATRRTFLEKSFAQTLRLESLLRDVATITRMDEGDRQIACERLSLQRIVEEAVAEGTPQSAAAHFRIRCELRGECPIEGNAALLHSVFRNLLDNAVAYSGGDEIRIALLAENADGYLLSVADNGSGVGEEHLPHLFERFYRIDKGRSRKAGGTGLGLAIVKNAVQFHGGTIEVRNREEGGLEFLFSLRRRPDRPGADTAPASTDTAR